MYHDLDSPSINLIMDCVSKASSTILVNGTKTDTFLHSRSLRQGDPMSPYLFNICLKALTQLIHKENEGGNWTLFWVGKRKVSISYLMFADDLLFLGGLMNLRHLLSARFLKSFVKSQVKKLMNQRVHSSL